MDRLNTSQKLSFEPMASGEDADRPTTKQAKENEEKRTRKLLRRKITADVMELKDQNGMISHQYLEKLTSLARHVKAYSSLSSCGSKKGDVRALESVNRILEDEYLCLRQAEESMTLDLRRARTEVRTKELRASIDRKVARLIAQKKRLRARHALDGEDKQAEESLALDKNLGLAQASWGQEPLRLILKACKSHALDDEDEQAEESITLDQRQAFLQARDKAHMEKLRAHMKEQKARLEDFEQAEESITLDQLLARIKSKKSKLEAVKRSHSLKAIASKRSGPKKL